MARMASCSTTSRRTIHPTIRIRGWCASACGRASDMQAIMGRRPDMKLRRFCLAAMGAALVLVGGARSAGAMARGGGIPRRTGTQAPLQANDRVGRVERRAVPARVQTLDQARRIDVNNINMWVTNFGSYAWDIGTG